MAEAPAGRPLTIGRALMFLAALFFLSAAIAAFGLLKTDAIAFGFLGLASWTASYATA